MSDNTSYRELLGELERLANVLAILAETAEEVAKDTDRSTKARDMAKGISEAYYASSNEVLRILCHALGGDDGRPLGIGW